MEGQSNKSENLITSSVLEFLNKEIKSSQQDSLDEIVLEYVVSVLEILASDTGSLKDYFDVSEFCEMLNGYFPGFENIPHEVVSKWIFDLVTSMKKQAEEGKPKKDPIQFESLLEGFGSVEMEHDRSSSGRFKRNSESSADGYGSTGRDRLASNSSTGSAGRTKRHSNSDSSTDSGGSSGYYNSESSGSSESGPINRNSKSSARKSEDFDFDSDSAEKSPTTTPMNEAQYKEQCLLLCEMFNLQIEDVNKALIEANYDVQLASERILEQMDRGTIDKTVKTPADSVKPGGYYPGMYTRRFIEVRKGFPCVKMTGGALVSKDKVNDEKVMKDRIVARYGFIDKEEDKKEFRPPPLKTEPKKLLRYRESQVVSTKGERYSEVRCKDGGELKPYIHKPNKNN